MTFREVHRRNPVKLGTPVRNPSHSVEGSEDGLAQPKLPNNVTHRYKTAVPVGDFRELNLVAVDVPRYQQAANPVYRVRRGNNDAHAVIGIADSGKLPITVGDGGKMITD